MVLEVQVILSKRKQDESYRRNQLNRRFALPGNPAEPGSPLVPGRLTIGCGWMQSPLGPGRPIQSKNIVKLVYLSVENLPANPGAPGRPSIPRSPFCPAKPRGSIRLTAKKRNQFRNIPGVPGNPAFPIIGINSKISRAHIFIRFSYLFLLVNLVDLYTFEWNNKI